MRIYHEGEPRRWSPNPEQGTGYTNDEIYAMKQRQRAYENDIRHLKRQKGVAEHAGWSTTEIDARIRRRQGQIRELVGSSNGTLYREYWRETAYVTQLKDAGRFANVALTKADMKVLERLHWQNVVVPELERLKVADEAIAKAAKMVANAEQAVKAHEMAAASMKVEQRLGDFLKAYHAIVSSVGEGSPVVDIWKQSAKEALQELKGIAAKSGSTAAEKKIAEFEAKYLAASDTVKIQQFVQQIDHTANAIRKRLPSSEAVAKLESEEDRVWKKLTEGQKKAIKSYTASKYASINRYLRGQEILSAERTAKIEKTISDIRDAIGGYSLTEEMTFIRRTKDFIAYDGWQVGEVRKLEGFTSTSRDYTAAEFAGYYRTEIICPPGTKGMYVDKHSSNRGEAEFLLSDEVQYEVLFRDDAQKYILLRVVV